MPCSSTLWTETRCGWTALPNHCGSRARRASSTRGPRMMISAEICSACRSTGAGTGTNIHTIMRHTPSSPREVPPRDVAGSDSENHTSILLVLVIVLFAKRGVSETGRVAGAASVNLDREPPRHRADAVTRKGESARLGRLGRRRIISQRPLLRVRRQLASRQCASGGRRRRTRR